MAIREPTRQDDPTTKDLPVTHGEFQSLNNLVVAVLVIMALGFVTLMFTAAQIMIDNNASKNDGYSSLSDENNELRNKVNALEKSIMELKDDYILKQSNQVPTP